MKRDLPPLNVLRLKSWPIFQQLQLEEALLRADDENWCLINEGSSPAIVMGISGKQKNLINDQLLRKHPIPVIRRFSGGGTVVVDGNTIFITLICNSNAVDIPSFPQQVLCWSGELYRQVLKDMDFCVKENDYVIGDRKFGGNAQYLRKNRWLHHSSLLWDFDPKNMDYLKIPSKVPTYRKKREHNDFLCRLCDFLPSKQLFFRKFLESLTQHFICNNVLVEDAQKSLMKTHRKSTKHC